MLVAAGTFGYGVEFAGVVRVDRLGGLIVKTLTRQPRAGNPPPRLVETPAGMLNAVGLQNIGLEAFIAEKLPALRPLGVPIIVSILGDSAEDVGVMVERLDRTDGVSAIELNLSCPNLKRGSGGRGTGNGLMVAQDPAATFAMVQAARGRTAKLLIAKLSPDVTDLVLIAQEAARAGAGALSLVNTFVGMSLDPRSGRSRLGRMTGGLSGPAIRPLAVYRVWYTAQAVGLPIIGSGGIACADDAMEFMRAGATAVAVGTANFTDPRAPLRVLCGLQRYLTRHRVASVKELLGTAQGSDD